MRPFARACLGLAALVWCGASACAQATIGELLDAGGRQLSKPELVALLSGATYSGQTRLGQPFHIRSRPDGSFSGSARGVQFGGRWWVEANGLHCWEVREPRPLDEVSCSTWFRKGSDYFVSDADARRDARLRKRVFGK